MHGLNELISTLSMRRPIAGEVMVSSAPEAPEASVKLVCPPRIRYGGGDPGARLACRERNVGRKNRRSDVIRGPGGVEGGRRPGELVLYGRYGK
jgi:hypothetical protein